MEDSAESLLLLLLPIQIVHFPQPPSTLLLTPSTRRHLELSPPISSTLSSDSRYHPPHTTSTPPSPRTPSQLPLQDPHHAGPSIPFTAPLSYATPPTPPHGSSVFHRRPPSSFPTSPPPNLQIPTADTLVLCPAKSPPTTLGPSPPSLIRA